MNLPLFVARKYFLSSKKKNFINVIAIISMAVVAIGTAALIIVLSVFNGLEGLLRSLNSSFDPEIKIEAALGKSFQRSEEVISQIKSVPGVEVVTEVIEDNALLKYDDAQMIVRVKGVTPNFLDHHRLDGHIDYSSKISGAEETSYAIVGQGIIYNLDINTENFLKPLQLYYPKNIEKLSLNTSNLYTVKAILPGATFAVEKQFDDNYIIVPIGFATELFSYGTKLNALELKASQNTDLEDLQSDLKDLLGSEYRVLTNDELHQDLYKILKLEKLIVFIILTLIIGIASVNIYFSLSMLVLDKKRDISLLYVMGANASLIRRIFLSEGIIISFTGAAIGLIFGLFVCLVQQYFGIVGMGMQSSLISAYPVEIQLPDLGYTVLTLIIVTILASIHPARLAAKSFSNTEL